MIKIDIFSGFLGAGKTTLIKKLLEEALGGEQVVLIENEFGEIGIDGGFLKDAGIEITEMNSGCICCSLVGDFGRALTKVIEEYHPDRILIEPSGVGKLSDVMAAVKRVTVDGEVELNSLVTIVNGQRCKVFMKNFGEFFINQVAYAKTIVISRTQNMTEAKLEETVGLLREHNAEAAIITTPWDDLDGAKILSVMEQKISLADQMFEEEYAHEHEHEHEHEYEHHHDHDSHDHDHGDHHDHDHGGHHDHDHGDHDHDHGDHDHDHHDHDHDHDHDHHDHDHDHHDHDAHGHHHHDHEGHHHADDVFTSWGVETPRKFTREEMESALKALSETNAYGDVLRAKGMVAGADGEWIYFDLVPEEYELRSGAPEYTGRICVIGTELKEDALRELFHV